MYCLKLRGSIKDQRKVSGFIDVNSPLCRGIEKPLDQPRNKTMEVIEKE